MSHATGLLHRDVEEPTTAQEASDLNDRLLASAERAAEGAARGGMGELLVEVHASVDQIIRNRFDPEYVGATKYDLPMEKMNGAPVMIVKTADGIRTEELPNYFTKSDDDLPEGPDLNFVVPERRYMTAEQMGKPVVIVRQADGTYAPEPEVA